MRSAAQGAEVGNFCGQYENSLIALTYTFYTQTSSCRHRKQCKLTNFIGNHECADFPLLLVDDEGHVRSTASKSSLVKTLVADANVHFLEHMLANINTEMRTSVVVTAVFVTRKWPLKKDTPFTDIAKRY